jgi:general secretion pathway protein B
MSFILDALKKSEAERQRQAGPVSFEAPASRPHRGVPTWVVVAGVVLVLANLLGLLWVLLRQPSANPPAGIGATAPATAASMNAPAAVTAARPAAGGGVAAAPAGDGAAAPVPPEAELALPEIPEDAHVAGLKRYATLGSTAPVLRLDLHVYSSNPAERYALINMRKLREGDTSEDGIKIKEITRSGVVLLYRGEELLLARD